MTHNSPVKQFELVQVERLWPNPRSKVTHLYVKGAGTGDGALCGQILGPAWEPSILHQDPVCNRCQESVTVDTEHTEKIRGRTYLVKIEVEIPVGPHDDWESLEDWLGDKVAWDVRHCDFLGDIASVNVVEHLEDWRQTDGKV